MSMKTTYEQYLARRAAMADSPLGPMYLDQERLYVHPFRIFGNVWYVGDSWVCVHLIDTGEGLLLLDSGNAGGTAMLIQAIWEAGFDPKDVKWIVHSHGHLDHIGASMFFKRMWGTKLYLGEPDARMFRERPWLALMTESHNDGDALFVPDVEIHDGDVLSFGRTTITFALTPGHTEGVLSCFFDAWEKGRTVRCGYYGGFGFNTLQKEYLIEIGDPEYRMRQVYLASLAKVRNERVELFLGNHCDNNDTLGRHTRQLSDPEGLNPFIDEQQWKQYLDRKREELLTFMADPRNS